MNDRAPLGHDECRIYWGRPAQAHDGLLALLAPDEWRRSAAFRQADDRARYLVAHALARCAIAAVLDVTPSALVFEARCKQCGGAHGKPYLREPAAGVELSLSHSGDRVVVAIARGTPVGVDVERISATVLDPAMIASPAELDAYGISEQSAFALTRCWVRKEATLKATGDGLAVAPHLLTMSAASSPAELLAWEGDSAPAAPVHLHDLDAGDGHVACLAMLGTRLAVVEHDGAALVRHAAADRRHSA